MCDRYMMNCPTI